MYVGQRCAASAMGRRFDAMDEANKKKGKEVYLKDMDACDLACRLEAVEKEWNTILRSGAVKVFPPHEAKKLKDRR